MKSLLGQIIAILLLIIIVLVILMVCGIIDKKTSNQIGDIFTHRKKRPEPPELESSDVLESESFDATISYHRCKLEILNINGKVIKEVELDKLFNGEIKIGRLESNDLVLNKELVGSSSELVGRVHAKIKMNREGKVYVKDLNSKNGTYQLIRDDYLEEKQKWIRKKIQDTLYLEDGMIITFATVPCRFTYVDSLKNLDEFDFTSVTEISANDKEETSDDVLYFDL